MVGAAGAAPLRMAPASPGTRLVVDGATTRRRSRHEEDEMSDNDVVVLNQNLTNPLIERMQVAAEEQGHGNATAGAALGALLGAMAGSFGGPWWVLISAGLGGAAGYHLGGLADEEEQDAE